MDQQNTPLGVGVNPSVVGYVEKLIEEKGFPDLTPEVKEEIKNDLLNRIDDFVSARIIAKLSDQDVATFEEMLKNQKSQEEIQQFITGHIDDFPGFLTNTLLEFRGVYLGVIESPVVSE
ncbi:MAG: DUF5663 domain-containing protein [Patescibacteria group bacterium]|nr:DUF5663 domain-containing protein [Patescibacteria group bacterium]